MEDPEVFYRVRNALKESFGSTVIAEVNFDIDKLLKVPLLESIYCETLRLRIQMYIMRYTDQNELRIDRWIFPKKSIVLVSTVPAHTDKRVWNTGDGGAHPVEKFWADRFLVYPDDPDSDPCRKAAAPTKGEQVRPPHATASTGPPNFTLSGTSGHFIPCGGGPRSCSGRHFAKRRIIAACAIMTTMFDIEILADDNALAMDPAFHGLGAQSPIGKVPFRIRKRQGEL
jgi:cytochrome P450